MVMKDGRIVEQGNHQQLLGQEGLYANLWELQQQEEQNQAPRSLSENSGRSEGKTG
jgi:ATP-binding cassette subfamily B protein